MKIMKQAEKKASGARTLHSSLLAEYLQEHFSLGEEKKEPQLLFHLHTTLAMTLASPSMASPFPRLEKPFSLPLCVILGKARHQGNVFGFAIKRGECLPSFSFWL